MPEPIALCLEDLQAANANARFLRCVALVGRQPGLRIRGDGSTSWQADEDVVCELWVSGDDRRIVYRRSAEVEVEVRVSRAGRSLAPPCDKPVVLLDGDELGIGPRRYKLRVHGAAPQIAPPSLLPTRLRAQATRATAVLAMGAAIAGCDKDSIEVREQPPDVDVARSVASTTPTAAAAASATATASKADPIEVRDNPPDVAPAPPPSNEPVTPTPHKPR